MAHWNVMLPTISCVAINLKLPCVLLPTSIILFHLRQLNNVTQKSLIAVSEKLRFTSVSSPKWSLVAPQQCGSICLSAVGWSSARWSTESSALGYVPAHPLTGELVLSTVLQSLSLLMNFFPRLLYSFLCHTNTKYNR